MEDGLEDVSCLWIDYVPTDGLLAHLFDHAGIVLENASDDGIHVIEDIVVFDDIVVVKNACVAADVVHAVEFRDASDYSSAWYYFHILQSKATLALAHPWQNLQPGSRSQ